MIFTENYGINILSGIQETFEALSHFFYIYGGIMKQYKTNQELIEYLISKNVIVVDKDDALKKIQRYSYYSIINGYKNVFKLKAGTLYPLLHGMEEKGLVTVYEKEYAGKIRKYYSLTKQGHKLLTDKTEEWSTYANAVTNVLAFNV